MAPKSLFDIITNFRVLIILAILLSQTHALTINVNSMIQGLMPQRGQSLADEIKCYSLPYGAIGFLSHILTYYSLLVLGFHRRPYAPWAHLSHSWLDICLSLTQVFVSVAIAGFTISRCIARWQFVCIAVWKMVLSIEVGIWGFSAAWKARALNKESVRYDPLHDTQWSDVERIWSIRDWTPWTLVFYAGGYTAGMVGLLALAWELRHIREVLIITAVFFSVTAAIVLVSILSCCCLCCCQIRMGRIMLVVVFTCILVGALYSDWVLAAIAGRSSGSTQNQGGNGTTHGSPWLGMPSGDHAALYWAYFAAKRLPLLMS